MTFGVHSMHVHDNERIHVIYVDLSDAQKYQFRFDKYSSVQIDSQLEILLFQNKSMTNSLDVNWLGYTMERQYFIESN